MKGDLAKHLVRLAVLVLVAGAATACGRKGALEPPPSASAQASGQGEQQSPSGGLSGLRAKKPPPVTPPKASFILDPLLGGRSPGSGPDPTPPPEQPEQSSQ